MGDFRRDIEGIVGSSAVMQIFNVSMVTDWSADVLPVLHIGVAVMLDKPLVVLVAPGETLPEKLRRVADHVITFDPDDPESAMPEITRALSSVRDGAN